MLPSATKLGTALIRIKALGVNHAELHMRRGEWAESVPISGIECVGIIEECPGNEFVSGTPVAALMGGLGRTYLAATRNSLSRPSATLSRWGLPVKHCPSRGQMRLPCLKATRRLGPVCSET